MRRGLLIVVAVMVAYVVALSVLSLWRSLQVSNKRLYRLRAVSLGMSRSAVITRLGDPVRVIKDNELIAGASEVLVYPSSTGVPDDLWVILDRNGRVASMLYPDIGGLAEGEISVGPAGEGEDRPRPQLEQEMRPRTPRGVGGPQPESAGRGQHPVRPPQLAVTGAAVYREPGERPRLAADEPASAEPTSPKLRGLKAAAGKHRWTRMAGAGGALR